MIPTNIFSFFKSRAPKEFAFRPRYYDPQKEESENRRKRIQKEIDTTSKRTDPEEFRSKLRERWERSSSPHLKRGYQGIIFRVAIIAAALAYVAYYVLQ